MLVARPFAHTGVGQADSYVVPAFARRLREARATGAASVPTGNLAPVRDLLDVRDVAAAYRALLARGEPCQTYNIARGADIPHLVGDSTKLRRATGWAPTIPREQTLRELVDAQAD